MWVLNGCASSVSFVRFNLYVRLVTTSILEPLKICIILRKPTSSNEQYSVSSPVHQLHKSSADLYIACSLKTT